MERLRAVKDDQELAAIKRACEITDRMFERLIEEPFVGRAERDVAWTIEQLFHEEGADHVAFETIVASGPNSARPHGRATGREIGRGRRSSSTRGAGRRVQVRLHTNVHDRPRRGAVKEAYAVVLAAQQAGWKRSAAASRASTPMGPPGESSTRPRSPGPSATGSGTASASRCTRRPACPPSRRTRSRRQRRHGRARIYLEGRAGIRIEDNVVVTDEGIENFTGFRKDLITVG